MLLLRDSVRQILASATLAKDADPMQVAIWGTALALTAPFLVAVRKIIDYPFLLRAPAEYVERVVLADRLFFVLYLMLATALVVALLWDSLSPTRHDQEIVGVLPVHPRTLAAARFTAAVGVGLAFAIAVTAPSAFVYSAASAVHPLVGAFPRVLIGHLLATVSASAFVFLSMLANSRADRRRRRRRGRGADRRGAADRDVRPAGAGVLLPAGPAARAPEGRAQRRHHLRAPAADVVCRPLHLARGRPHRRPGPGPLGRGVP